MEKSNKLISINISDCDVDKLVEKIGDGYWIDEGKLTFDYNISESKFLILINTIFNCINLVKLDLSKSKLKDKYVEIIWDLVSVNTTITHLDMSYNILHNDITKFINMLIVNKYIRSFNFSGNYVEYNDVIKIVEALYQNNTLEKLYLGHPEILASDIENLFTKLLEKNNTLTKLILKHIDLDVKFFNSISNCLSQNKTLISLAFINCGIENNGLRVLMNSLQKNTILEKLNIADNSFNCGVSISIMLRVNKSLKQINLMCNKFCDDDIVEIMNALATNNTIQSFNLYECISYEWSINKMDCIGNMLRQNFTLKILNIGSNYIYDSDITKIFDALMDNNSLQKINICWNRISNVGAKKIANVLTTNSSLEYVDLLNNNIRTPCGEIFNAMLKTNTTLTEIRGIKVDEEKLERNRQLKSHLKRIKSASN